MSELSLLAEEKKKEEKEPLLPFLSYLDVMCTHLRNAREIDPQAPDVWDQLVSTSRDTLRQHLGFDGSGPACYCARGCSKQEVAVIVELTKLLGAEYQKIAQIQGTPVPETLKVEIGYRLCTIL